MTCAKCGAPADRRYCTPCNSAANRAWRAKRKARLAALPVVPKETVPQLAAAVVAEVRYMAHAGLTPHAVTRALRIAGRIATLEMVKAVWPKRGKRERRAPHDVAQALRVFASGREYTATDLRRLGVARAALKALVARGEIVQTQLHGVKIFSARKMRVAA